MVLDIDALNKTAVVGGKLGEAILERLHTGILLASDRLLIHGIGKLGEHVVSQLAAYSIRTPSKMANLKLRNAKRPRQEVGAGLVGAEFSPQDCEGFWCIS